MGLGVTQLGTGVHNSGWILASAERDFRPASQRTPAFYCTCVPNCVTPRDIATGFMYSAALRDDAGEEGVQVGHLGVTPCGERGTEGYVAGETGFQTERR